MKILSAWVVIKNPETESEGLTSLRAIISSSKEGALGVGLAYALIVIHHLEKEELSQAHDCIKMAKENGFGESEDVLGTVALYLLKEKKEISQEIRELAQQATMGANSLVTKRLERFILFPAH